jgi:plasmid maintenance system antidote protein VapI
MGLREDVQVLIKKKGISIAKLARLSDVHQDTIYKFLVGRSSMTADNLDKIIGVLEEEKQ